MLSELTCLESYKATLADRTRCGMLDEEALGHAWTIRFGFGADGGADGGAAAVPDGIGTGPYAAVFHGDHWYEDSVFFTRCQHPRPSSSPRVSRMPGAIPGG